MAVTDEAIAGIKQMIVSGQLRPGDRLPPEKELSEHLGLSRSSLREAVKALEVIRVLDVRRGDGTYVTSLEPHLLLEAMSFSLPIIGSDAPAVREVLGDGRWGVVAQRADEAAWADAMAGLISDPARRASLGAAARRQFLDRYEIGGIADRMVELYREVAGSGR